MDPVISFAFDPSTALHTLIALMAFLNGLLRHRRLRSISLCQVQSRVLNVSDARGCRYPCWYEV